MAWSLDCKERVKHLFCDKYSWLMAVRKRRVFVVTVKKISFISLRRYLRRIFLKILYDLYFLEMERAFESM